jgi:outer membrane lipoprotein LolB
MSGCVATTAMPPADQQATWEAHRAALANVNAWDLRGRVALRLGNDSGQAVLHWVRQRSEHRVDLIFPFGAGSVRLTQDERGAVLRDTQNKTYRGRSARALLAEVIGWDLPIDELNFWVLGLPAPGAVAHTEFDEQARLVALEQGEWRIVMRDYFEYSKYVLPSRIEVERKSTENSKPLDVRLSVQDWTLSESPNL